MFSFPKQGGFPVIAKKKQQPRLLFLRHVSSGSGVVANSTIPKGSTLVSFRTWLSFSLLEAIEVASSRKERRVPSVRRCTIRAGATLAPANKMKCALGFFAFRNAKPGYAIKRKIHKLRCVQES